MAIYTNASASGSGQAALGFSFPTLLLVKLAAIGGSVSQPREADVDQILNAGWIAFGVTLDPFGDGSQIYWYAPIWINLELIHWPNLPTRISSAYAQITADTVRWHLSIGTAAKIYVSGS